MFFDQDRQDKPLKHRQLLNLLVAGEIDLKAHLARQPRPAALPAVSPVNCRVRSTQLPTADKLGSRSTDGVFLRLCALTMTLLLPLGIGAQTDPTIVSSEICPKATPCAFFASNSIGQEGTNQRQRSSFNTINVPLSALIAGAADSLGLLKYRRSIFISKTLSSFTKAELASPKICQMAPVVGSAAGWKLFDFETERQKQLSNTRVPVDRTFIPNCVRQTR